MRLKSVEMDFRPYFFLLCIHPYINPINTKTNHKKLIKICLHLFLEEKTDNKSLLSQDGWKALCCVV